MNDSFVERLKILADEYRLHLIISPRNAPLISGEEITLKKNNLDILRIKRRTAINIIDYVLKTETQN